MDGADRQYLLGGLVPKTEGAPRPEARLKALCEGLVALRNSLNDCPTELLTLRWTKGRGWKVGSFEKENDPGYPTAETAVAAALAETLAINDDIVRETRSRLDARLRLSEQVALLLRGTG